MCRTLAALCLALMCLAFAGCGGKNYTGEQRYALSGKVNVDGQPMEAGLISFVPQGDGRVSGGPIKGGTYSIEEGMGPTAGKYRVEIHWSKPTGKKVLDPDTKEPIMDELKEGLPDKYHKKSELSVEVSSDQTTFDFDTQSK